jgi:microcin C transport system ATP-binding protein
MKGGKVVEEGAANEIFSAPKMDYTRALMDAALNLKVAHRDELAT